MLDDLVDWLGGDEKFRQPSKEDGWFTVDEVAERTGGTRTSVYANLKSGVDSGALEHRMYQRVGYYRKANAKG